MKLPFDFDWNALWAKQWVRITAYTLFFVFCFVLFAYWSFPYDRLRDYVIHQVEYPAGPGGRRASGWELDIVDLSPSWGTGITAEGVRVAHRPEHPGEAPVDQIIDELTLRVHPLAFLLGTTEVSFDAEIGDGSIEGSYARSEDEASLETELDALDLGRMQIVRGMLGIPLAGIANGAMDFTVDKDPKQTEGELALTVDKLAVGDGQAKLKLGDMREGLTVDRIDAGKLTAKVTAEQGVARIDQLHAKGKDAELTGKGTVRLLLPLDMSRLDMLLRIKFADSYRNESDRTRALFSLMEFNPQVRQARAPDGALQFRVAGSFGGRLVPTPAGKAKLGGK